MPAVRLLRQHLQRRIQTRGLRGVELHGGADQEPAEQRQHGTLADEADHAGRDRGPP